MPGQPNDDARPARDQLEQLLAEINALAICLKRASPSREGRSLPPAVRGVLEVLQRRGPMSVPALARARGTSRQNLQIIANRLTKEGWANKANNPRHKRSELLSITANGSAMLASGEAAQAGMLAALLAASSQPEVVACIELMRRLRQALGIAVPLEKQAAKNSGAPQAPVPEYQALEAELPLNLL